MIKKSQLEYHREIDPGFGSSQHHTVLTSSSTSVVLLRSFILCTAAQHKQELQLPKLEMKVSKLRKNLEIFQYKFMLCCSSNYIYEEL